jgi:Flp pilus assembly secretin CpaC
MLDLWTESSQRYAESRDRLVPASSLGAVVKDEKSYRLVDVDFPVPVPFQVAALLVAEDAGLNLALSGGESGQVQATMIDVPADVALNELGRMVGLVAVIENELVRFIAPDQASSEVAVIANGVTDAEVIEEVLKVSLPGAEAVAANGRVAVVGSRAQLTQAMAINEALQGGRDGWLVDVQLVQASQLLSRSLGIGTTIDASANVGAAAGLTDGGPRVADASIGLAVAAQAVLTAVETQTDAKLITTGSVFVMEGGSGSINQGESVPIPQRTTSPEGTVSVSGFTFVDTGFLVDVGATRLVDGRVLLNVSPELSNVTGFVEDAPTIARSRVESTLILEDGQWSVLSGLDSEAVLRSGSGLPGRSRAFFGGASTDQAERDRLLVLVRARRISASS